MIREAIQEIVELTKQGETLDLTLPITAKFDGVPTSYTAKVKPTNHGRELGEIITPFRPSNLSVTTLTGFLDAIKAGCAGDLASGRVIHVESYLQVAIKSAYADEFGVRDTFVTATHTPAGSFTFDQYYSDLARFIIGLQVNFLQTEELLYLIKIASNLKAGNTVQVDDDGFGQTVTLKTGEVSTVEKKIERHVKLIPLRTFAECNPVESEFLIRFQQTRDQTPSIALFDLEGTKWQGELMRSIKKYLVENLPAEVPVLA
jgi:hypothetical protein